MTRLELVKMLAKECRLASLPATTLNQNGEYGQAVDDIDEAYAAIQRKVGGQWLFLQGDFSIAVAAGTANYPPAAGLNHKRWKVGNDFPFRIYLTATGYPDEQWVYFIEWNVFRDLYLLGSDRTTTGRPTYYTIKPDKSIQLYPVPDAAYTLEGEYWRKAYAMTADDDEPAWPERDHDEMIVWKALELWAAREEEPNRELYAKEKFKNLYLDFHEDQLPTLQWGAPLA